MDLLRPIAFALATFTAGATQAHVSIQPTTAAPGAYQVLRFGVGHGCSGDATTAVTIRIPPGTLAARPQPKPGWTLEVDREGDVVRAIRWRGGPLPADQFEEFVMLVHLPERAGPLAFPALQTCGARDTLWGEPTPPGGPRPRQPAPVVTLIPAPPPEGGHDHH
ncbi:YcnI family protein [Phenylobacterium kunshanense]|uniref:YncI copper-binding domain-containing protein n=1 Tax=Phenylobacterium kunshanense TaxID=1445034 RepID=A0A328BJP8_9CAUL|nr:YcnI family protein [Phenylobacterium kunshanense]RAK67207.1 hypothetical protein DJ019_04525 [Phenylobacterium kunshanense]